MLVRYLDRRKLMTLGAVLLLAGCKMVPKGTPPEAPPPPPPSGPSAGVLPTDTARHRVALLVPLSGSNSDVGQSLANAATMALLDTNAQNLRVTNYDTSKGASNAAQRAIADGNKLILGPLLSGNIAAVSRVAGPAGVPLISFTNDENAAAKNVYVMGNLPGQSINRTVSYARKKGLSRFAALVPQGEYGQRTSQALADATRQFGGSVVASETYDRSNTSITSAARRLRSNGNYEAVLIADGGRMALRAAPEFGSTQIIGTELWSGERSIAKASALNGAWYASVSDQRFGQFSKSYQTRFGSQPYRIATLGYDAVLLTLRVAQAWKPGATFPTGKLADRGGFLGLDGPFRFGRDGVIERALEVREVRSGAVATVSPAPSRFND